jgi:hypothetical protein
VVAGGSGLTACELITEQDASGVIGTAAGKGSVGGTAAFSECIYADGALLVTVEADSKALYDKSLAAAQAKGLSELPAIGDSAFQGSNDQACSLLMLKGTTLVSVRFTGTGAQNVCVAVAKIGASKL